MANRAALPVEEDPRALRGAPAVAVAAGWRSRRVIIGLLSAIALVLVVEALRVTYLVTMPLAFAFFLAVLVHPIKEAAARRLPRRLKSLSLVAPMAVILAVLVLFGAAIWLSISLMADSAPEYGRQLQNAWNAATGWLRQKDLPVPELTPDAGSGGQLVAYLTGALSSVWTFVGVLVLVFFFVLLMLMESGLWRRKVEAAFRRSGSATVIETVTAVAEKIRRYLLVRTLISVVSGVIAGAFLWLVGVDFWYVWGFLFFALNYVPNIGSIIAGIPPILIAFLQFGWAWALFVAAGLTILDQILGNYIDPKLQGRTLDISPLVVLVSVILWSWIWGPVGAVLAVPIMVTVIIVCAHVPALRPAALLLSGSADRAELDEQTQPD